MENSEQTATYKVGYKKPPKDKSYKPGQSGNLKGRPRDPLKQYSLREFNDWNDKQKKKFLDKVSPLDRWKMTEGNPSNDVTSGGEPINVNIINYGDNSSTPL